jgi:CheY-like chemotaxis protein
MNILIVDDSIVIRKIHTNIVRSVNPNAIIFHAENGFEALEYVCNELNKYNLVILDVNMPGMSGDVAFREMRKNEATQHIPVLFITTESTRGFVLDMLKLGAVDYLLKPIRAEDLKMKLIIHNLI